jgi:hypothetical protein
VYPASLHHLQSLHAAESGQQDEYENRALTYEPGQVGNSWQMLDETGNEGSYMH